MRLEALCARYGILLCAALLIRTLPAQSCTVAGRVIDKDGLQVAGAAVTLSRADKVLASTISDRAGNFTLPCVPGLTVTDVLRAEADGQKSGATAESTTSSVVLRLEPTTAVADVSVMTTRSSMPFSTSTVTSLSLTATELQRFPAFTLDQTLRQVAGFELFRRTPSWAANPTSEGISLRGLGSTAASRSLVLLDGAPLNDGFGGWVHWNELPQDALEAVVIQTGGGSDLYGSSALGGVIDVIPSRPVSELVQLGASGASEDTSDVHGRIDLAQQRWGESIAGESFRTAGYLPLAPALLGPVDRPANVHNQAARLDLERRLLGVPKSNRLFLTANLLNEARNNGTVLQTNGTRLWRWLVGDEWSAGEHVNGRARVFGSDEHYRQTFSSINASRSTEILTRIQKPVTQEVGITTDATAHWRSRVLVAGVDVRDLRADDVEQPLTGSQAHTIQTTPARQRFSGGFLEGLASKGRWFGAASVRVDRASNLAARTDTFQSDGVLLSSVPIANRSELLASPRLGLSRSIGPWQIHLSAFRAFRSPTMNELYRQGQVGQQITLANPQLRSERATGAEGGAIWQLQPAKLTSAVTYFWTEINRPVSTVLVSSTPTTITNVRQNLGQIQSQGVEVREHWNESGRITASLGYQYAHAVVTAFSAQPALVGKWLPNVPRQSVTAQLRTRPTERVSLTVAFRAGGKTYDDSSNIYPLAAFTSLDLFGEYRLPRGWDAFVSVQNALDQRAQVARTPLLTLGNPILWQGGLRYRWERQNH